MTAASVVSTLETSELTFVTPPSHVDSEPTKQWAETVDDVARSMTAKGARLVALLAKVAS